jgi:hypothetical protein
MKKTVLISALFLISLISCTKEEVKSEFDNPILGIWVYSDYQDKTAVFSKGQLFTDNHCYNFKPDGSLIERKNSSWCGTPPILYNDYYGKWNIINDTTILIDVGYWGGNTSYYLDIESVDAEFLKVITVPINQ